MGAVAAAIAATVATGASATAAPISPFAPPPWPPSVDIGAATATSDPVRPLSLGKLRVLLDSTDLAAVRTAVGGGTIVRQGNGSDALTFLCYTVSDAGPPQRLWLSSSELAGGSRIDGVAAVELPAGSAAAPQCPELPAQFRPLRFEDGLWLGALGPEHKHLYGAAAQNGTPWSASYHERHGSVDVLGSLALDLRRGRIVGLFVAHGSQH
jgi:hypothetical protein